MINITANGMVSGEHFCFSKEIITKLIYFVIYSFGHSVIIIFLVRFFTRLIESAYKHISGLYRFAF